MGVEIKKRSDRPYSIIVWGASGYTGGLIAEYLVTKSNERIAIAARTKAELEAVKCRLAEQGRFDGGTVPILSADVHDRKSLNNLVSQTSVIIAAAGPYCQQGDLLIAACIESGTDYLDLSEEPYFDRQIIDKYHDRAEEANVLVVSGCGMASIPSDLGAYLIAEKFHRKKLETKYVRSSVVSAIGGISGGTVASFCHQFGSLTWRQLFAIRNDPDFLAPGSKTGKTYWGPTFLHYDKEIGSWQASMIWEIINRARVRRSNWILKYGHEFQYCEGVSMSNVVMAAINSYFIFLGEILLLFAPIRWILQIVFPSGYGPSREIRQQGKFELKFVGEAESGEMAYATIKADLEPGYQASAMMVSEAALCLALDRDKSVSSGFKTRKGGVVTPASAMGMSLVERLRKAGMELKSL